MTYGAERSAAPRVSQRREPRFWGVETIRPDGLLQQLRPIASCLLHNFFHYHISPQFKSIYFPVVLIVADDVEHHSTSSAQCGWSAASKAKNISLGLAGTHAVQQLRVVLERRIAKSCGDQ